MTPEQLSDVQQVVKDRRQQLEADVVLLAGATGDAVLSRRHLVAHLSDRMLERARDVLLAQYAGLI